MWDLIEGVVKRLRGFRDSRGSKGFQRLLPHFVKIKFTGKSCVSKRRQQPLEPIEPLEPLEPLLEPSLNRKGFKKPVPQTL
ncbi:MAG: hypothetical protein DI535_19210 [Citrobacter freundii]|nr:MAG: hypothetical protein DI535_19210 [Citrobacter freundii]